MIPRTSSSRPAIVQVRHGVADDQDMQTRLHGVLPVLAGLLATTLIVGCGPLDRLRGQESPPLASPPLSSPPATSAEARGRTADLETTLARLGNPGDAGQVVASAESLATALGEARAAGKDLDKIDAEVNEAVDRALSSLEGRKAMLATTRTLDGHAFTSARQGDLGAASASLSTGETLGLSEGAALRAQLVAEHGEPIRFYFVNGIFNTLPDALSTRERLINVLGTDDVTLVYNRSLFEELRNIDTDACLRAIRRAGMTDELLATNASWQAWMGRPLSDPVTSRLRAACQGAVLGMGGGRVAYELMRGALELALQRTTDANLASSAVNSELVPMLKADVLAHRRVIVIGHSQGTMFAHNALEQVRAWWEAGADGRRPASCEGLIATPHVPVGALYISPAFTTNNDTRLERYVALRGDVLLERGVSSSEWTARPDSRQHAGEEVDIHAVTNYLLAHSESLGQVTDNLTVLRTALGELQGMDPCPDSTSATASASPSPEITSGASEWVVWRAPKPFEGIGINVTSKRSYLEDNIASSWSGGGRDSKATFAKEMLIDTVFPSKEEAMKALCADVRMWPLGTGMHGVWKGTPYPLGDSVQCPSS